MGFNSGFKGLNIDIFHVVSDIIEYSTTLYKDSIYSTGCMEFSSMFVSRVSQCIQQSLLQVLCIHSLAQYSRSLVWLKEDHNGFLWCKNDMLFRFTKSLPLEIKWTYDAMESIALTLKSQKQINAYHVC